MNFGVIYIALSLLLIILAIIFGRYSEGAMTVVLTFLALGLCIMGAIQLHINETYTMVEFNSDNNGVVRIYDYKGDVMKEYHGDIRMIHESNGIVIEQNDNAERIFITDDGDVKVVDE